MVFITNAVAASLSWRDTTPYDSAAAMGLSAGMSSGIFAPGKSYFNRCCLAIASFCCGAILGSAAGFGASVYSGSHGTEALCMYAIGLFSGALGALAYTLVTFIPDEMMRIRMQEDGSSHKLIALLLMLVGAEGGAGDEEQITWDCWRAIIHADENEGNSQQGKPLYQIIQDARVKSWTILKLSNNSWPLIHIKNQWAESFIIHPVVLPCGQVAGHATKVE